MLSLPDDMLDHLMSVIASYHDSRTICLCCSSRALLARFHPRLHLLFQPRHIPPVLKLVESWYDRPGRLMTARRVDHGTSGPDRTVGEMLQRYCWSGKLSQVKEMLEHGAPVNAVYAGIGGTPIGSACYHGRFELVRFLLCAGADPNLMDQFGSRPLHYCVRVDYRDGLCDYHECTLLLLRAGADPTLRSLETPSWGSHDSRVTPWEEGETPLQQARRLKGRETVALLKASRTRPPYRMQPRAALEW
jgi:hypothetical protein